jgi:hypothetical protein
MKYATFETHPCVYDDREAWVLFDTKDGWRKYPLADVEQTASPLSKSAFDRRFPHLPPIPSAAFQAGE